MEGIELEVDLDVLRPAGGRLYLDLTSSQGKAVEVRTPSFEALEPGRRTRKILISRETLRQLESTGPIRVPAARLSNGYDAADYLLADLGATAEYPRDGFYSPTLAYRGFSEKGFDADGDGRFDRLDVTVDLDVADEALFRAKLTLTIPGDGDGETTLEATGKDFLRPGRDSVTIRFSGPELRAVGRDGPYELGGLEIRGNPGELKVGKLGETGPYRSEQFEGPPPTVDDLWPKTAPETPRGPP